MAKLKIGLWMSLCGLCVAMGAISKMALASGPAPGYIYSPASGSSYVKTAYGECLHTAYWKKADGIEECGEAPVKISDIESNLEISLPNMQENPKSSDH